MRDDLTAIVEFLDEAVINRTLDGRVIAWNAAAERIFGYSAQEMIGNSVSIIVSSDRPPEETQIVERCVRGERIEHHETHRVRKDGRVINVSLTYCPIQNETGRIVGISEIATDIDNRKRLQQVERDQLIFSAIVASSEEASISKDLNGNVTSWNRAAQRLFGYTAEEVILKSIAILIPDNHHEEEPLIMERIRRGERIENYETQRTCKDGRIVAVSLTVSPIKDRLGCVIGASLVVRETTDRRRIEKVERDQLFLAAIVSSADDAIMSKDLDGIITSWNGAAERLFGYTEKEIVGKAVGILIPKDHFDEEQQILKRIRRGERIEQYETQRIAKDGRSIDVSLTVSPIRDRMGYVIGASKIVRDITERRHWESVEAEQSFLGALIESTDGAIISKNLDGDVTSWNPAAEKLYGYTAQEMVGKPIALLIPPEHHDEEPHILEEIRRGGRIEHYETKRRRKDGVVLDVSLTVSPIRDRLGRVIGASKIARNITDQKAAETRERDALRQAHEARQLAEQASLAKDEFLATVSHELRTPLTAILGWVRILAGAELTPETQRKAIESIERNAISQAQLVEDLLDISRIVSGKLRIQVKLVDMSAVIAAAVDAVRPTAEANRIQIQTILSSTAGLIVGDFERLQQVVWNLLSNAIRFTPADGLVKVELVGVGSQLELRVSDTGIGMKPEFLPHAFERFSQADNSITRSYNGLGMGLAIVKSLVELHGGVILASSAGEKQGSMFTVRLPISSFRHDSVEPFDTRKPSSEVVANDRQALVGLKILLVDDQKDNCELLGFIFSDCGALVESANSAAEALLLFDSWKPDILVSDIGMSKVDGYELIRILRKDRHSRIPAVALTAMARIEDRAKALTAGYQMHVAKPIDSVELISIVASLVGFVDLPVA